MIFSPQISTKIEKGEPAFKLLKRMTLKEFTSLTNAMVSLKSLFLNFSTQNSLSASKFSLHNSNKRVDLVMMLKDFIG